MHSTIYPIWIRKKKKTKKKLLFSSLLYTHSKMNSVIMERYYNVLKSSLQYHTVIKNTINKIYAIKNKFMLSQINIDYVAVDN